MSTRRKQQRAWKRANPPGRLPEYASSGEQLKDWRELSEAERIAIVCLAGLGPAVPVEEQEAYRDVADWEGDGCLICKAERFGGPEAAAFVLLQTGMTHR